MGMILPGMLLRDRTALITGASSGIGAATATALSAVGCRTILVGRDSDRLDEVAGRTGGTAVTADLAQPDDIKKVVHAARNVDLLINNAGTGWAGDLDSMTPEDIATLVAVNLTAPIQLTRALLPDMRLRSTAHVVFVASIAVVGVHGEAVYSATKAGLRAFAASLRHETQIGMTTVLPGAVATPFFARRGRTYDRGFPRQVPPETVATAMLRAVERNQDEVFVPSWLTVAARIQGAVPGIFHRLSGRFG
jgi:short-subunit dehydrogenase